ncbi:hypothetical protein DTO013E5_2512 [Penicillium roqueforti]|uniref:uncharacterized protein n=1 Tax=Penicillium roqueforti TaxID=5082 RepID=UPI00190B49B8|nr:uncharacterized protein LCP9604111_7775 [Penicillium roqueforti]KAF9242979.1 hypothetical protein LCP9604111_7775 [Penicillium roqueforti]KAI1838322.1 hypothetical protein CBS147337_47 [Penicillium roqueforti]KAI2680744.1 hypothetical protein CBS147355_3724 [Penicillium roqueforti]KAI2690866.1 hypothetical protein LCP963914a_1067 [Penicillium roqueforti]KAI2707183.1 hypothetical protein CBS147372_1094 [Penicillium roqueforti]
MEKLSEQPTPVTQEDFAIGMGPAYTTGKYLCRLAENEDTLTLMRIYKQIPLIDTEPEDSTVRKEQACGPRKHVELGAMKRFTENGCTATPSLLVYQIGKQDEVDLVSGGYITYLVWEKVPGDPLDIEQFWIIREALSFKYEPIFQTPTKIIVDESDNVKICGFSRAFPVPNGWRDDQYVMFSLVLASPDDAEYLPASADDLKSGPNGWKW